MQTNVRSSGTETILLQVENKIQENLVFSRVCVMIVLV